MAHYPCEMFGHFLYSPELEYEELGELEQKLKQSLLDILEASTAVHVEYREYGDSLAVQCQFPEFSHAVFAALCTEVQDILTKDVQARFLFVDRANLESALFFAVNAAGIKRKQVLRFTGLDVVYVSESEGSDQVRTLQGAGGIDGVDKSDENKGAAKNNNTDSVESAATTAAAGGITSTGMLTEVPPPLMEADHIANMEPVRSKKDMGVSMAKTETGVRRGARRKNSTKQ